MRVSGTFLPWQSWQKPPSTPVWTWSFEATTSQYRAINPPSGLLYSVTNLHYKPYSLSSYVNTAPYKRCETIYRLISQISKCSTGCSRLCCKFCTARSGIYAASSSIVSTTSIRPHCLTVAGLSLVCVLRCVPVGQ